MEIKLWTKRHTAKTLSINPEHVVNHSPPENLKGGGKYLFYVPITLVTGKNIKAAFRTSDEANDFYKLLDETNNEKIRHSGQAGNGNGDTKE